MMFAAPYERLQIATDAAAMRSRLEECLQASGLLSGPITRVRIPRVIPRRSGEVLVQYRISSPGLAVDNSDELTIYGEFFPDHIALSDEHREHGSHVNHWNDICLRVWSFPRDPRLRHLASLLNGQEFTELYGGILDASALGFSPSPAEHRISILGYRLGRRLVARLSYNDSRRGVDEPKREIVVKMCRPRQALTLWARHRQLEHESLDWCGQHDSFLPSQYAIHEQTGALFQESRAGRSLHDSMNEPSFVDGCRAAMEILTTMQHFQVTGLPVHRVHDELDHLNWLIEQTGAAFPNVASGLKQVFGGLNRTAPEDVTDRVVCHRDFYDKQVLYNGTQSTVIDFDTLAESDAALDFGNFIAHLRWRKFQAPESVQFLQQGEEVVRESMLREGAASEDRAHWWTSAAMLRIACIYLWRPRWHKQAIALLAQQVDGASRLIHARTTHGEV